MRGARANTHSLTQENLLLGYVEKRRSNGNKNNIEENGKYDDKVKGIGASQSDSMFFSSLRFSSFMFWLLVFPSQLHGHQNRTLNRCHFQTAFKVLSLHDSKTFPIEKKSFLDRNSTLSSTACDYQTQMELKYRKRKEMNCLKSYRKSKWPEMWCANAKHWKYQNEILCIRNEASDWTNPFRSIRKIKEKK